MFKYVALCASLVTLSACSTTPITRLISSTRQSITPIPDLPPLELENVELDWPRTTIRLTTTECRNSTSETCNPSVVDTNSNLFIGMTENNYESFVRNLARFVAREQLYNQRINSANAQRNSITPTATPTVPTN